MIAKSCFLFVGISISTAVYAENFPTGFWLVSSNDARVEIYQNDDQLEGKGRLLLHHRGDRPLCIATEPLDGHDHREFYRVHRVAIVRANDLVVTH